MSESLITTEIAEIILGVVSNPRYPGLKALICKEYHISRGMLTPQKLLRMNGITFFRYDNATKKMIVCDPPGFEVRYFDTSYALPRTGKDIIVTTWNDSGKKEERALKWNGHLFTY